MYKLVFYAIGVITLIALQHLADFVTKLPRGY